MENNQPTALRDRYTSLEQDRQTWLNRAHRSALLTIPSIQMLENQASADLPMTFQSLGARGVNNLASKLNLTLFPTQQPFVRLTVSDADMEQLTGMGEDQLAAEGIKSEIEQSLLSIEQQVASEADQAGWRPVIAEMLRNLVVTGNCLVYDSPDGPILVDMRRYVVHRSPEGRPECIILKQSISPVDAEAALGVKLTPEQLASSGTSYTTTGAPRQQTLDLYSGCILQPDGRYMFSQEIAGTPVPDSEVVYRPEDCPLLALRWAPVFGEHWGRSFVEDLDGDLLALSQVSRALVEASMVMSKVVWLVRPGSSTKPQTLSTAPNGAIRVGDPEDIGCVRAEKGSDLATSYELKNDLIASLSKSMLLNSGVQRTAERVTAEEIRVVSMELEDALGGVYASLAENVQRPLVEYLLSKMQRIGAVAPLPKEVQPKVIGGLDAITRNHHAVRMQQFLGSLQQVIPPDQLGTYLRVDNLISDFATALNIEGAQYVKSQEEIQAELEAQQQQAAVQALGPQALKNMAQQQTPEA